MIQAHGLQSPLRLFDIVRLQTGKRIKNSSSVHPVLNKMSLKSKKAKLVERTDIRSYDDEGDSDNDQDYVPSSDDEETVARRESADEVSLSEDRGEETREATDTDEDLWASFIGGGDTNKDPSLTTTASPPSTSTNLSTLEQTYDFAGEEVRVSKAVSRVPSSGSSDRDPEKKESSAPKRTAAGHLLAPKKVGGLSGALDVIKKKKISTLEKSKLDWSQFKDKEGISEEVESFNKGKSGYLERQSFLERSDYRQFTIERDIRQKGRRKP